MDLQKFLKDKGLKVTKGRLQILEILCAIKKGITAEFIFEQCKKSGASINLSTVYRCLESFEEKEIVDKFSLNDGICYYKIKGNEHKHLLQCSVCDKEVEVPCPMKQFEDIVQNETGFTVTEHKLVMKGLCEQCRHKKN